MKQCLIYISCVLSFVHYGARESERNIERIRRRTKLKFVNVCYDILTQWKMNFMHVIVFHWQNLKDHLANLIPQEQKKIKEFRAKHNNTVIGDVTVDKVSLRFSLTEILLLWPLFHKYYILINTIGECLKKSF